VVQANEEAEEMGIEQLEPFIGEWSMDVVFPNAGITWVEASSKFDWILDGQFLVERSEVDHPQAPNGFKVVGANADGDGYTQHYFDSRGIARVYAMTFEDGDWELLRVTPDFTPLDFCQRYVGRFSDDGNAIEGRWETSSDGSDWQLDFQLNYSRR
jgi:hypothetical protein